MSVIRTFHDSDHPFTMLANEVLYDETISNAARGLWCQCMRRPDDWTFRISEIVKNGKDKKTAIYSQLKELIRAGYVLRLQIRNENPNKKILFDGVDYVFFEKKVTEEKKAAFLDKFKNSFPHSGFLEAESLEAETDPLPILINTNTENKNIITPTKPAEEVAKPMPAGGNNNKFYKSLEEATDLSPRQKAQLNKYPEEVVAKAVTYCYHPNTKLEGPAARIKQLHAYCKNPDDYELATKNLGKTPEKKLTAREKVLHRFKKGSRYNGYEFTEDDTGPCFIHPNGMHTYSVSWKDVAWQSKWLAILKQLGIPDETHS